MMQQEKTPETANTDDREGIPPSEEGFDHSTGASGSEPLSGESTERDPSWRPGGDPPGQGIYSESDGGEAGGNEGTSDSL